MLTDEQGKEVMKAVGQKKGEMTADIFLSRMLDGIESDTEYCFWDHIKELIDENKDISHLRAYAVANMERLKADYELYCEEQE